MADDPKFAVLRPGGRSWAVAAIHGEAARLGALHGQLAERIRPGDNLIYLGNVLGRGEAVAETIDELLRFRRAFLARPAVFRDDVAYLRGSQEEMWHKLLQIQFAPNPGEVLTWMMGKASAPPWTPMAAARKTASMPPGAAPWRSPSGPASCAKPCTPATVILPS